MPSQVGELESFIFNRPLVLFVVCVCVRFFFSFFFFSEDDFTIEANMTNKYMGFLVNVV